MPRQSQIDAPGALHHITAGGNEKRKILFHLFLRTGLVPISTIMRRLLTRYAIYFNCRHRLEYWIWIFRRSGLKASIGL